MSKAGRLNILSVNPSIPTSFLTDSGFAVPAANILQVLGGTDIVTSASGNVITISFSGSSGVVTSAQGTSPIQINGVSGSPQIGALIVSLLTPLAANFGGTGITNASGSTITLGGAVVTQGKWNLLGAFDSTFRITALTDVTFPTSGTLLSSTSSGFVSSVFGTTNRVTISPTTGAAIVDIASTYVGQTSIITLGTVTSGAWNATEISGQYGGTGVANTGLTITLASGSSIKAMVSDSSGNATWSSTISGTLLRAFTNSSSLSAGTTNPGFFIQNSDATVGNWMTYDFFSTGGNVCGILGCKITNQGLTACDIAIFGSTAGGLNAAGITLVGATNTVSLANALPVSSGGTGQTSYTNGQILIGNTTGNTLTKSTLTQGAFASVTITNSTGSITLDTVQDIRTSAAPTFAGATLTNQLVFNGTNTTGSAISMTQTVSVALGSPTYISINGILTTSAASPSSLSALSLTPALTSSGGTIPIGRVIYAGTASGTGTMTTMAGGYFDVQTRGGTNWSLLSIGAAGFGSTQQSKFDGSGVLTLPLTAGSVMYASTSGVVSQDNSGFFYDATNHRLGLSNSGAASLSDAILTINANTTAVPAITGYTVYSHIIGAAAASPSLMLDSFGGGSGTLVSRVAAGTAASPTALVNNMPIFTLGFSGYTGSAYANPAGFQFYTAGNWTGSANGTAFFLYTTLTSTTTTVTSLSVNNGSLTIQDSNARQLVLNNATSLTASTTGGGLTLPLLALGYIQISLNGTQVKIPYYTN